MSDEDRKIFLDHVLGLETATLREIVAKRRSIARGGDGDLGEEIGEGEPARVDGLHLLAEPAEVLADGVLLALLRRERQFRDGRAGQDFAFGKGFCPCRQQVE